MNKFLSRTIFLLFIYNLIIISTLKVGDVIAKSEIFMRVLQDDVYIYSDSACTQKLFEVPKTYYLRIDGNGGEIARVSYGDDAGEYPVIMGYAKISELTPCDYQPVKPFAITKIATTYQDVLFNDNALTCPYFNVPTDSVMIYYGEYNQRENQSLIFVYYNNKLGYFDKSSVSNFLIPDNKDPIEEDEPTVDIIEPDNNLVEQNKLSGESLQIIIIVGLSVISISIVYALFKPTKNKTQSKNNEFFDEG